MESSATWWVAFEGISTFLLFAITVVLAAIAIFPEHVRQLIYKPLAHVFYGTDDYLLQQMSPAGVFPQLYVLRLRVKNVGKSLATLIECHVTDIRVITAAGREQRHPNFIPVRLRWTHSAQNAVADYLAVGTSRVVDLADITGTTGYLATGNQPTVSLTTDIGARPFSTLPPGKYVIELTITSREGTLFRGCLKLSFAHHWQPSTGAASQLPAELTIVAGNLYEGRLIPQ